MCLQAIKIRFYGLSNISQSLSPRFPLRDAAWQRWHLGYKDSIFILFNQHSIFHSPTLVSLENLTNDMDFRVSGINVPGSLSIPSNAGRSTMDIRQQGCF